MTSPYIKRHILQAIEHLRARKARPDLHRICNQLKRRHNCSINETTRCVDHLLDMGIVIKVEYKGSMSYRDASKWKKGHVAGHIMNSNALVAKLQAAIDAIVGVQLESDCSTSDGRVATPKTNGKGATPELIEAWLKKQPGENGCHLTGDALFEVLTREVEMNTLRKSGEDGTYTVGKRVKIAPRQRNCSPSPTKPASDLEVEEKPLMPIVNNSQLEESAEGPIDDKRQRPPSNRKRIKKYRDEIYELPPIKKSRKQTQAMEGLAARPDLKPKKEEVPMEEEFKLAALFRMCNEVHQTEVPSYHAGQDDEMLVCCGCQMKAHPACLNYSAELLTKIERGTWRCVTCKKCAKCDLLLRTPSPMTCSGCDLAYHKSCHKPIMRKKPKDDWLCMKCKGTDTKPVDTELYPQMHPKVNTSSEPMSYDELNSIRQEASDEAEQNETCAEADGQEEEDSWDSLPAMKAARDTSFPPTPSASPLLGDLDKASTQLLVMEPDLMHEEQKVKKVSKFDGQEFPDPTSWTVDQIYQFIRNADGDRYAEGAEALKREEIDGEALMCLKRDEILSNFSLKVGPAVKLYRLIVNMRTNGNAHLYI